MSKKNAPLSPEAQRRLDQAIMDGVPGEELARRFGRNRQDITDSRRALGVTARSSDFFAGDERVRLGAKVTTYAPIPEDIRHRSKTRRTR